MICNACKENIELHHFDIGDAFEAISPISFRMGTYHRFCYEILIEKAKELESKHPEYSSRYDEFETKYL